MAKCKTTSYLEQHSHWGYFPGFAINLTWAQCTSKKVGDKTWCFYIGRTKHTIVFFRSEVTYCTETRGRDAKFWLPSSTHLCTKLYDILYTSITSILAFLLLWAVYLRHPMNRTLRIFPAVYVFYVTHVHICYIFWKHYLGLSYSSSSKWYSKSLEYRLVSGLFYLYRLLQRCRIQANHVMRY